MGTASSYEAKTHLSQLLSRTAKGEQITITKHGVPVAMLVPARGLKKQDVREVIHKIREFRKGLSGCFVNSLLLLITRLLNMH